MALDVRGGIKNTKLSTNPYVVFEELISNAIDSFLIRKFVDTSATDLTIALEINFFYDDLYDEIETISISCSDNGCGLGEEQRHAFLTKDTSYKDDLQIPGIGKCKGAGRIQFFHHFSSLSVNSTYFNEGKYIKCKLNYAEPQKEINEHDFIIESLDGDTYPIGTIINLKGFKNFVRERVVRTHSLAFYYSASMLKKKILISFLQRLIGLEACLGKFEIKFTTKQKGQDKDEVETIQPSDLPKVTRTCFATVFEQDPTTGDNLDTTQQVKISHYKLAAEQYKLPKNSIAFCAKSSPVQDITSHYLRTTLEQNNPIGGFNHIILIESEYFDQRVNEQRDGFDSIPDRIPSGQIFSNETISFESIHEAIDPFIDEMVAPPDWKKEKVLTEISTNFGINEQMLQDTSTRIRHGESAQVVAERVLKKYQEKVVSETAELMSLKDDITKTEPDSDTFREKINELSWKYTSSLKNFDMANLSQLIVRRAAIVEILSLACSKQLLIQTTDSTTRQKNERIIHSIFFPMRRDTTDRVDHDIWLLGEEYHYYDYIASDLPLANIPWKKGEKIFEEDIDDDFRKLLEKRDEENSRKRPDIALFSGEGSVVIVEFKAPGVSLDDHVGDLWEYAQLLAAKSRGKIKKFYGYLIGDTINSLRLDSDWTPFPASNGWFKTKPLIDPATRSPLGQAYFELLHFSDVIERAKKRIGVYQDKLKFKI